MTTILVVDDELSIVEVLCLFLEIEGFTVITASNGKEAIARLQKSLPDIVLCDVMMPVMDGRQLSEQMQVNPKYRSIPIIMMSAVNTMLNLNNCHYTAFLAKPFDLDEVLNTINRLSRVTKSAD